MTNRDLKPRKNRCYPFRGGRSSLPRSGYHGIKNTTIHRWFVQWCGIVVGIPPHGRCAVDGCEDRTIETDEVLFHGAGCVRGYE